MSMRKCLTFDDVLIEPRYSELETRREVDVSTRLGPLELPLPLISAEAKSAVNLTYPILVDQEGKTGAAARNFVAEAIDSLLAGVSVRHGKTKPYGCSVKYKT